MHHTKTKEKWTCTWCTTVDMKNCAPFRTTNLWYWFDFHPLLVHLPSQFDTQISGESDWGAGQIPKSALTGPLFTLRTGWIMPQSYAIKGGHGCTIFLKNLFGLLWCLYSLGESSFLIKSIQAPFHLAIHITSWVNVLWILFTISF
jgi:hypothetical protein